MRSTSIIIGIATATATTNVTATAATNVTATATTQF